MRDLKNYLCVSGAYWGFTLTDGALRMLVLLHFHALGYEPVKLAMLFLLYEAMGVVTNFYGGWIGARFGLRLTLFAGLALQVIALVVLSLVDPSFADTTGLGFVQAHVLGVIVMAQALSGIAKDLTKMSSKSAVKLVIKDSGDGGLFRWVAALTGSKNALKGVGFFLGGLLLSLFGFKGALWAMAGGLAVILIASLLFLKQDIGKAKDKVRPKELFSKSPAINYLSLARVFLFSARDVWFVVAVPVFLSAHLGWGFDRVGAFMAIWVIGYGFVQAGAPKFLQTAKDQMSAVSKLTHWGLILALSLVLTLSAVYLLGFDHPLIATTIIAGLLIFGAAFAVNSSLHSYLIVAFSDADKVALNVGFYYMSNAIGRFVGTLLSGVVYQFWGFTSCLSVSLALVVLAWLVSKKLKTYLGASA